MNVKVITNLKTPETFRPKFAARKRVEGQKTGQEDKSDHTARLS